MVSKKSLIELFESKLPESDIKEIYAKGFYFKGLEFYSNQKSDNSLFRVQGDCRMALVDVEDIFYLTFNSIKVKITEKDYSHLKEMMRAKEMRDNIEIAKKTKEKDRKLLDSVFSEKNKKETRKTIIEKNTNEN
ncbi:MAG TPA: hypothetical protein VMZ91_10780 [Candidatus Paceibacterota bacterium]|nr:hypothetical protein [Candidatus Paceibacterota bacterium]